MKNHHYRIRIAAIAASTLALASTTWADVIPIANPGGPYFIFSAGSLSLDGSASLPSDGQSITSYDWDLDDDNDFDEAISGATPTPIDYATLVGTYGMTSGLNKVTLRVTDDTPLSATADADVYLDTTLYIGTSGSGGTDKWSVPGNWNGGVPTGAMSAIIPDKASAFSVAVTNSSIPIYDGDLTIGNNVTLQIGWANGTQHANLYRAVGTPGVTTISMGNNSKILNRNPRGGANWIVPAVNLYGNATFQNKDSTELATNPSFDYPVTGSHPLNLQYGTNTFKAVNSFSALNASLGAIVVTSTAGTLGTGNVTINDTSKLSIGVADSIADSATLTLNAVNAGKLTLNADETINKLSIDGFIYPAGTYGRVGLGTVDHEYTWIAGNSTLTVSSDDGDTTAPTVTFAAIGQGGSSSQFYETEPITYTITFSEPHTPALTAADLENATATAVTIGSVTPVSLSGGLTVLSYKVQVLATESGTINLRIKAGTVIEDVYGNVLVVPAADDETLTVDPLPAYKGELGVWKPWSNNRINPQTGLAWAVGDTYRLAFITSNTGTAISTNIADYNSFVQSAASASTAFPDLGNGTWNVIGSTATTNARVNTGTDTGTGVAVLLMNGSTVFANNNADLWDGTALRTDAAGIYMAPYFDQNGVEQFTDHSVFTGTNSNGTSHTTQPLGASPGNVNTGKVRPNSNARWMIQYNAAGTSSLRFFAMSDPLNIVAVGDDVSPPTVTNIVDDKSGGPITVNTLVSYTVTFSEDIATTLNASHFDNEGTATITIGSVTETAPSSGIFTVQVTPTSVGTLKLRIKSDALIEDASGNDLVVPVSDDTTITVQTHYQAWANGAAFGDDANGDSVSNGLAFLLGAANPNDNALALLPKAEEVDGALVLTFSMRNLANRGSASLSVEHSSDLGLTDAWDAALVPETSGTVNDVVFVITENGIYNDVIATIPASKAEGGKLFGRLKSNE